MARARPDPGYEQHAEARRPGGAEDGAWAQAPFTIL
jgi:hypothetical protein